MNKPIIAVDIDDVLADGTVSVIDAVNRMYGVSLTEHDYHSVGGDYWGYYGRVWQAHGLGEIVNFQALSKEMAEDQSHVPLLAGAEFAMNKLSENFHIIFITARPSGWEGATRRWFEQHLAAKDIELYFAGNHHDDDSKSKGELAHSLGASVLIDDNVTNCRSALDEGLKAILFGEYGWQSAATDDMIRCKDWQSVLEYFDAV